MASTLLAPSTRRATGRRPSTWVTVESRVDPATAEAFYDLYLEAFAPLRTRAVGRQVLHREEFLAEMRDPRVLKFVAWDDAGLACGLTTLTRHLETVPWISPEYFAEKYPEHHARGAIYYLGFTLVARRIRRQRVFHDMIGAVVDALAAARAVCGYDICAYNTDVLGFADNIELMLRTGGDATVARLDTQTYYGADFSLAEDRLTA